MSAMLSPLLRVGARRCFPGGRSGSLPILMYHRVLHRPDPLQPGIPDAVQVDRQFRTLAEHFRVLPLPEAMALQAEGRLPDRSLCITFDDGYRDNFDVALPLLREHGLTATVFVASGYLDGGCMFNDTVAEAVRRLPDTPVDLSFAGLGIRPVGDAISRQALIGELTQAIKYQSPEDRLISEAGLHRLVQNAGQSLPTDLMLRSDQVLELHRQGVDIGGHTVTHPILSTLTTELARHEIQANREALHDIIGRHPALFAYPNGKPDRDYDRSHTRLVAEAGYAAAVSTAVGVSAPGRNAFEIPRFVLQESSPLKIVFRLLRMARYSAPALASR
jgi:peptidoglycan/xylan/chitin deacetylase (PgdA/CDA1 family)